MFDILNLPNLSKNTHLPAHLILICSTKDIPYGRHLWERALEGGGSGMGQGGILFGGDGYSIFSIRPIVQAKGGGRGNLAPTALVPLDYLIAFGSDI